MNILPSSPPPLEDQKRSDKIGLGGGGSYWSMVVCPLVKNLNMEGGQGAEGCKIDFKGQLQSNLLYKERRGDTGRGICMKKLPIL